MPAGRSPFRSESLMGALFGHVSGPIPSLNQHRPELPETIDPVIARGMAKTPDERYPTCRELVGAARGALGVSGSSTQPARLRRAAGR